MEVVRPILNSSLVLLLKRTTNSFPLVVGTRCGSHQCISHTDGISSVSCCSKVFHVRSVTQGDVIRADAKDIPRIFQLLYAGEGEARRPGDAADAPTEGGDHTGKLHATRYRSKDISRISLLLYAGEGEPRLVNYIIHAMRVRTSHASYNRCTYSVYNQYVFKALKQKATPDKLDNA